MVQEIKVRMRGHSTLCALLDVRGGIVDLRLLACSTVPAKQGNIPRSVCVETEAMSCSVCVALIEQKVLSSTVTSVG